MAPAGKRNPDTPYLATTAISADRTAGEIQEMLGRAGARRVMTDYDDGEVVAVSFSIMIGEKEILFRLPVRWHNYFEVLKKAAQRKAKGRRVNPVDPEQAKRTAWRVAKSWLEAQLALVQSEMAELQEVMLPYVMQDKTQTLYEKLTKTGYFLEYKSGNPG